MPFALLVVSCSQVSPVLFLHYSTGQEKDLHLICSLFSAGQLKSLLFQCVLSWSIASLLNKSKCIFDGCVLVYKANPVLVY